MFERFTDGARRAVVLAQEEARSLQHDYIGTEHLLLGLIHEGRGPAARVFAELGIELDAVRQEVLEIIGPGAGAGSSPGAHIAFTPRAKRVLELSLREALQLGDDHIGPEHILLGLVREGEGVAAHVLERLGVGLGLLRNSVVSKLGQDPEDEPPQRSWLRRRRRGTSKIRGRGPVEQELQDDDITWTESWPLEHFDEAAWDAVAAARAAARDRSAPHVDAYALLIGIARVEGPGADALAAVGLVADTLAAAAPDSSPGATGNDATLSETTDDDADTTFEDADTAGVEEPNALGPQPFSPTARAAIVWAAEEANRRAHVGANTGHLLLALLIVAREDIAPLVEATDAELGDVHAELARRIA